MSIQYDKPFKTYDELIVLMESRGIIVDDKEFAKAALSSLSYYTLVNGYKDTFLSVPNSDNFIRGTTFSELYTLYQIDCSVNAIILKYILRIEGALKSRISYTVAQSFGVYTNIYDDTNTNPNDYLCKNNYSSLSRAQQSTLNQLKAEARADNASDSVKHYLQHHNHIPPWILTTTLSFGNCIYWYKILKPLQKDYVTNEFINSSIDVNIKKAFLIEAFQFLRFFRNSIAHGHKTFNLHWDRNLPKSSLLSLADGLVTSEDYQVNPYSRNGLFALIVVLLLIDDFYGSRLFATDLIKILNEYLAPDEIKISGKNILDILNLPANIFQRIITFLNK